MSRILLFVVLAGAVLFWWHWNNTPDAGQRRRMAQKVVIWTLLIGSILLVLTGRMHWLGAALAGLVAGLRQVLPLVVRYFPVLSRWYQSQGAGRYGQGMTTISTRCIRMTIDHRTGAMTGTILYGSHTGRELAALSHPELISLREEYLSVDPDSVRLLDDYIASRFTHSTGHTGNDRNKRTTSTSEMDVSEALQILGLDGRPDKNQITDAYRRLMQLLHPDRGGNAYLSAKVNQARDVLMKKFGNS